MSNKLNLMVGDRGKVSKLRYLENGYGTNPKLKQSHWDRIKYTEMCDFFTQVKCSYLYKHRHKAEMVVLRLKRVVKGRHWVDYPNLGWIRDKWLC